MDELGMPIKIHEAEMKLYFATWIYASDQAIVLNNIGNVRRLGSFYELKSKKNKDIKIFLTKYVFYEGVDNE